MDATSNDDDVSTDVSELIEAERARMAADIHDHLVPLLFVSRSAVERLQSLRATNSSGEVEQAPVTLEQLHGWLDEAMGTARKILTWSHLPETSLSVWHVQAKKLITLLFPDDTRLEWSLGGYSGPSQTSESGSQRANNHSVGLDVYRIATESIRNAIRHSQAKRIRVEDFNSEDGYTVIVSDDGRGFSPSGDLPLHYGLVEMRRRAQLRGMSLQTESKVGGPTRISIHCPRAILEQ